MPPTDERPRERLLTAGSEALTDAELLALVLGAGQGAGETGLIAQALLRRFGSLHALEQARLTELIAVPGIGPVRAAALRAALALGRRLATRERSRGLSIQSAADVFDHLGPHLRHAPKEQFHVLLLDARHRLLAQVRIAEGGLTACAIHPREAYEPAVREGAVAVIFVHNHPSGDPAPSRDDLTLTQRLQAAGEALGIRALDHVVIGDGRYVSLAEQGLIGVGP